MRYSLLFVILMLALIAGCTANSAGKAASGLINQTSPAALSTKYILPIIPYPLSKINTGHSEDTLEFFLNGIRRDFPKDTGNIKIGFSVDMPYLNFVQGSTFDFNSTYLKQELDASVSSDRPIMVHLNGHRFTYEPNFMRLINNLSSNPKALMYTQDGTPISMLSAWDDPQQRVGSDLWSLNIFNSQYRSYKKKNIQQAGMIIASFAKNHPDLFAGVSLDSEISFCPAGFSTVYNFDFNPDTIVQYRMWLAGVTGDYKATPQYSNPYIKGSLKGRNLRLTDINRLYGTNFTSWQSVSPPKSKPNSIEPQDGTNTAQWADWLSFKSSMINEMLGTTTQWLADVGVPQAKIYSHQPLDFDNKPSASYAFCGLSMDSPKLNAGSYGVTAYGDLPQETALMSAVHKISPSWGIVEWNPLDSSATTVAEKLSSALIKNDAKVVCPNFYLPRQTGNVQTTYNIYDNPSILAGIALFVDSQKSNIAGYLDGSYSGNIAGWAADTDHLNATALVTVRIINSQNQEVYSQIAPAEADRGQQFAQATGYGQFRGFSVKAPDWLYSGERYTITASAAIPYGPDFQLAQSPMARSFKDPVGYFDGIFKDHMQGWSADPDHPTESTSILIEIYDEKMTLIKSYSAAASVDRGAEFQKITGYTPNKGFVEPIPPDIMDGRNYTIRIYGIDIDAGQSHKTLLPKDATYSYSAVN